MKEAGAPSTGEGCFPSCARPTGGTHVRTTEDPAQRRGGAERRPRPTGHQGAAKGIIKAELRVSSFSWFRGGPARAMGHLGE
jgi:hypothetical protein